MTSYFYNLRFFENQPNILPLNTAIYPPKWYHGLTIPYFVPGPTCQNLCHGATNCPYQSSSCAFLKRYYEQLEKVSLAEVSSYIAILLEQEKKIDISNPTVILLFYETPQNPCSERAIVKKWFNERGIKCDEWKRVTPSPKKIVTSLIDENERNERR